jgi:glycosyltransferase involved in cell wall biosynthesis
MKVMLFCWAQEMKTELLHLTSLFAQSRSAFIITPLVRLADKRNYLTVISQVSHASRNISVDPIYLKSRNIGFRDLLRLNILVSDFLSLFRVLNRSRPDVIVCYYVLHAYPLVLLKVIFRFSLCVVAMGSDINLENSFFQRFEKACVFRNSELIFARSWKLKKRIENEYGYTATVIPSAADPSFFKPLDSRKELRRKWGVRSDSFVVLTVCSLDRNKGVDILIKSIKDFDSDNVDLLIAGEGVEREALDELALALGIRKYVIFLGFKSRDELLELYNLADVFALASYAEGLPRTLIEAMASGCIPVVTSVGDAEVVVRNGANGFLVSTGDHVEFAERFKEVIAFSKDRKELFKSRARAAVVEDFDSVKLAEKMIGRLRGLYYSTNPANKANAAKRARERQPRAL